MRSLRAQRTGISLTTIAIDFPSGENLGEDSAVAVDANGVDLPEDTSTMATSEVGQSLATPVFTWLYAILLPSGDQSNPVTCLSSLVSFREFRLPAPSLSSGTTYKRAYFVFSSIQRKSFLPLSFFSSSSDFGSVIMKAMDLPSGDHSKSPTLPLPP